MKLIMLVLVIVVMAGNVWADCRVYEYAELKDMTEQEMNAELKITAQELVETVTNWKRTDHKAFDICTQQRQRINDVKAKKFPAAPSEKPDAKTPSL